MTTLFRLILYGTCLFGIMGCERYFIRVTDRDVAAAIEKRQNEGLNYSRPAPLGDAGRAAAKPERAAYSHNPASMDMRLPAGFEPPSDVSAPASRNAAGTQSQPSAAQSQPVPRREKVFTLTDALAYAQQYRREYQTAKEDLYLVALALTLERHLWTPIFAADLRAVYGNYGEIRNFDQAMRYVASLSAAQRLPYGGEFTARAVSTLVRDIQRGITASEGSGAEFGLNIPFLRKAGHVAREQLIQLERNLTYAVRDFERFRRRQLVEVTQAYFDLLRSKQDVLDTVESLGRFRRDLERAQALQDAGTGELLDTRRAEQQVLSEENRFEDLKESFRSQADQFKLQIGMPVDEPLGLDDLEDIDTIERQVEAGAYPLLRPPPAVHDEARTLEVALAERLDLTNRDNQVDDAKRGVAVAANGLLPDLDWTSTLSYETDPEHFKLGSFEVARATWRSELLLSLPVDRVRERNQYRAALVDVQRAQRAHQELKERIRAEVRRAVNQFRLEERSLEIQQRNLEVSDLRREYARLQFYDGKISNRDLVEAEAEWSSARTRLNFAKTSRWRALLDFRLATETLRVEETGEQRGDAQ